MPIEHWHLLYFFTEKELEGMGGRVYGLTLMASGALPLGFGGVYFDNNSDGHDVAVAFFYGGPNQVFARKYLKLALTAMQRIFRRLIEIGCITVYACVDKNIPKSDTLALWLGGKPTGFRQDEGEIYVFDLTKMPLTKGTKPWL